MAVFKIWLLLYSTVYRPAYRKPVAIGAMLNVCYLDCEHSMTHTRTTPLTESMRTDAVRVTLPLL